MKNYIIIESSDQVDFSYRVSSALNDGYECVGSVSFQQSVTERDEKTGAWVRKLHFAQGMVKTTWENTTNSGSTKSIWNDHYEDQFINVGVSAHMHVRKEGDVVNIWDTRDRPGNFPVVVIKLKHSADLAITGVAMRHRETREIFSASAPARHDALIRMLADSGKPDFAKGEQGFVDASGAFLTREEAFVRATRTGQLLADGKILLSEDVW